MMQRTLVATQPITAEVVSIFDQAVMVQSDVIYFDGVKSLMLYAVLSGLYDEVPKQSSSYQ